MIREFESPGFVRTLFLISLALLGVVLVVGTIEGSVAIPRQVVEWWADPESPYFRPSGVFGDFDQRTVTFCDGGGNGAFAAVTLQELGYRNVATLEGGFYGWVGAGLPTVAPQ